MVKNFEDYLNEFGVYSSESTAKFRFNTAADAKDAKTALSKQGIDSHADGKFVEIYYKQDATLNRAKAILDKLPTFSEKAELVKEAEDTDAGHQGLDRKTSVELNVNFGKDQVQTINAILKKLGKKHVTTYSHVPGDDDTEKYYIVFDSVYSAYIFGHMQAGGRDGARAISSSPIVPAK